MSPTMSSGSRTPVDSLAGRTAAKTARLMVLAPLTEVLEKPTSSAAAASRANAPGVIVSMRRLILCPGVRCTSGSPQEAVPCPPCGRLSAR